MGWTGGERHPDPSTQHGMAWAGQTPLRQTTATPITAAVSKHLVLAFLLLRQLSHRTSSSSWRQPLPCPPSPPPPGKQYNTPSQTAARWFVLAACGHHPAARRRPCPDLHVSLLGTPAAAAAVSPLPVLPVSVGVSRNSVSASFSRGHSLSR
jgi:hypothetical protein